jgi:hypothetical protein
MKTATCKCGGSIRQDKCFTQGFLIDCLKCEKCNDILFTPDQTKQLIRLREANSKIEGKRKIVKVGSSIAALLPKKVESYGVKEGLVDSVRVLSTTSLEIRFNKEII